MNIFHCYNFFIIIFICEISYMYTIKYDHIHPFPVSKSPYILSTCPPPNFTPCFLFYSHQVQLVLPSSTWVWGFPLVLQIRILPAPVAIRGASSSPEAEAAARERLPHQCWNSDCLTPYFEDSKYCYFFILKQTQDTSWYGG